MLFRSDATDEEKNDVVAGILPKIDDVNNRTIRNMSLAQTLRGFKKDNQKSKLLRIFDNTDHK